MYIIDKSTGKDHVYPTYGRRFCTYKWFKPLLTAAVGGAIYAILVISLMLICTHDMPEDFSITYESLDFNDLGMSIFILGSMAMIIPALWCASRIVRDRPFSSYSSSRGGWNFRAFFICLIISFVINACPEIYAVYKATGFNFDIGLSFLGFLIIIVVGSLQCIGEEYLFRGLFMQTIGSWIGIPVVAIILQAVIFSLSHAYNIYGLLTVLISGLSLGFATYITRGIEASSAVHICNNVPLFLMTGLHLIGLSSDPGFSTVIYELASSGLYIIILIALNKKTRIFAEVRKDDLAEWNEKYAG